MFCPFCGEYYKQAEKSDAVCRQCGYDMSIGGKIGGIDAAFDGSIKQIAFTGEYLYHTWQQMVSGAVQGKLFYTIDGDKLLICAFLGTVASGMQPFRPDMPIGCYSEMEFWQEITCDDIDSYTGCCAWKPRLCCSGIFAIGELTMPERMAFVRWLLANEPYTVNGRLQYDLCGYL